MSIKNYLSAAILSAVVLGNAAAFAEDMTLDLSQPPQVITLPPGQEVILKLNNPTSAPLPFYAPSVGIQRTIPANSSAFVDINADLLPSQKLEYNMFPSSVATSTTTTTTTVSNDVSDPDLSRIINYNSTYTEPAPSQPHYYEHNTSTTVNQKEVNTVRGYW